MLDNCKSCGKLMIRKNSVVCAECYQAQTSDMDIIKQYMFKHPKATCLEVHQDTGIPMSSIYRLVMDKRIEYRESL